MEVSLTLKRLNLAKSSLPVGATTPVISCFSSPRSSMLWSLQSSPVLDAHPGVLYDAYARSYAYSQACSTLIQTNNTKPGEYVSTPYTARDMLEISRQLGQKKLHYWGFSYGTFLGVTFASLWPEEVGRMVLDGNVDAVEYSNASGVHFLSDTDKVWQAFSSFCHAAGEEKCGLWADSPSAIERRVEHVLREIKITPIIVPATLPGERPEIVSYSTVRTVISRSLYRPIVMFPLLAEALAALELGNGLPMVVLADTKIEESLLCETTRLEEPSEANEDASNAILCSDNGGWMDNGTVADFGRALKDMEAMSKSITKRFHLNYLITVHRRRRYHGVHCNRLCWLESESKVEVHW